MFAGKSNRSRVIGYLQTLDLAVERQEGVNKRRKNTENSPGLRKDRESYLIS